MQTHSNVLANRHVHCSAEHLKYAYGTQFEIRCCSKIVYIIFLYFCKIIRMLVVSIIFLEKANLIAKTNILNILSTVVE